MERLCQKVHFLGKKKQSGGFAKIIIFVKEEIFNFII